jgi:hypothetical protein
MWREEVVAHRLAPARPHRQAVPGTVRPRDVVVVVVDDDDDDDDDDDNC